MPTMLKSLLHITFFLALATVAGAQYLPGTLQGGPPAPGTKSRSPLNSLERAANNLPGVTIVTDSFGNQRFSYYVRVLDTCINYNPTEPHAGVSPLSSFVYQCGTADSLFYVDWKDDAVLISVGGGAPIPSVNWYNTSDTTTDALRTATILQSAEWIGDDPNGYLLWLMGTLSGGRMLVDANVSTLYFEDLAGSELIEADETGIEIRTSNTASRAVDIQTDTMNWSSSFDPTLMRINYLADGTYMFADSVKNVSIGQFPIFPDINLDGTEKGFVYSPDYLGEISMYNGNGAQGDYAQAFLSSNQASLFAQDGNTSSYAKSEIRAHPSLKSNRLNLFSSGITNPLGENRIWQQFNDTLNFIALGHALAGGEQAAFIVMGKGGNNASFLDRSNKRKFAIETYKSPDNNPYLWMEVEIPAAQTDTTTDRIKFYNGSYPWQNARPSNVVGDTSFHFWAGNGTNTNPGFITLDEIRGDGVNWYNSNGITDENTRIADVLETATWRSNDVQGDGVYPFRFELAGASPNEPEMMVYKFPAGDSATLSQSDQEIIWFSSNIWSIKSNEYTSVQADSFQYNPNLGGTAFKVGANNVITQNAPTGTPTQRDALLYNTITGTGQTELFLDGSSAIWVVPANSAENAKINVTAICSNAGNGVGITTGESWESWHLCGIKRVTNATSLIGTVQTAATAQSDTGMSTSVVTIDADDTDESLRIRFTPPTTAGSSTVIRVAVSLEIIQTSY